MLPSTKRKKVGEDSQRKSSRRHKEKKDKCKKRLSSSPEQEWVESSVFQGQGADVHHYKGADVQLKREDWMTVSLSSSLRDSRGVVSIDLNDSSKDVSFGLF